MTFATVSFENSEPIVKQPLWKTVLTIWWCGLLTVILGTALFETGALQRNFTIFQSITLDAVWQNFLVIVAVMAMSGLLYSVPALRFSWLQLFGSEGTNVNAAPMSIKWFGPVFGILLLLNLPDLALGEEKMFRLGVVTWEHGLKMSVLFGLCHCIVGVPIFIGLALTVPGLWFTYQCFEGGITQSTMHHTTYNLIIIGCGLLLTVAGHFVKPETSASQ